MNHSENIQQQLQWAHCVLLIKNTGKSQLEQNKIARHQAITWTNVDLSLVAFYGTHLRPISQKAPKIPIREMSLNTLVKLIPCHSGANEVMMVSSLELW